MDRRRGVRRPRSGKYHRLAGQGAVRAEWHGSCYSAHTGPIPPRPPARIRNDCEEPMPQNPAPEPEQLLTPSEVAAMFRVNPKTVTRWARAGKISAIRTLGGHRRFRASEIRKFLEQVDEANELE